MQVLVFFLHSLHKISRSQTEFPLVKVAEMSLGRVWLRILTLISLELDFLRDVRCRHNRCELPHRCFPSILVRGPRSTWHCGLKSFLTIASLVLLAAGGWTWFTAPRTSRCAAP